MRCGGGSCRGRSQGEGGVGGEVGREGAGIAKSGS